MSCNWVTWKRAVTGALPEIMSRQCGGCCSRSHPTITWSAQAETHSVRELCQTAFGYLDLDWQKHVTVDPKLIRPAEVDLLVSDPRKVRRSWAGSRRCRLKG